MIGTIDGTKRRSSKRISEARPANRGKMLAAHSVGAYIVRSKYQKRNVRIQLLRSTGRRTAHASDYKRWGRAEYFGTRSLELLSSSLRRAVRAEICASILESVQAVKLDTARGSCVRQSEKSLASFNHSRANSISSFLRRRAPTTETRNLGKVSHVSGRFSDRLQFKSNLSLKCYAMTIIVNTEGAWVFWSCRNWSITFSGFE